MDGSTGTGLGGGGTTGATEGGAIIQIVSRGAMDDYLTTAGGTKSYGGSSTGATEGAYLLQLYARDKQSDYLSRAGSADDLQSRYWEYLNSKPEYGSCSKTNGFFETIQSYTGPHYRQALQRN
jgi:hypothetical protein